MRLTALAILIAAALLSIGGCGSGGGSFRPGGNGTLTARALWEQPRAHTTSAGLRSAQVAGGGFGPTIPAAVKAVVVKFQSASDSSPVCATVAAASAPVDPATGQRSLLLPNLPGGPGSVMVFGFATDTETAQEACEGLRLAAPSYRSDSHAVTILPGRRIDAGDIDVFAVPFPLNETLDPPPNGSATSPVTIRFTLAVSNVEGVDGIDESSIQVTLSPGSPQPLPVTAVECDDASGNPCSAGGALQVSGFQVATDPQTLAPGRFQVTIHASVVGFGARDLDFTYEFSVLNPGTGALSGTVVNCLTGASLAGATVELVEPGPQQVTTGIDGKFRFDGLPLGSFQLDATATGFILSEVSGVLDVMDPVQVLTVAVCPVGGSGLRVVLTWGSGPPAPADLDAHLRGPAPATSVAGQPIEFHLDFNNPSIIFARNGGATLDIDSQSFAGPETETVDQLESGGLYRYCVHDFTDRLHPGSQGLANSEARVRVFLGNEQQAEFLVPSGPGTVWEVFGLDTTQAFPVIVPVNALSDESDPGLVCRRANDGDGDGLTEDQEATLGTDPDNADSNFNGVSDGQDVINGNDPLPPR